MYDYTKKAIVCSFYKLTKSTHIKRGNKGFMIVKYFLQANKEDIL